MGRATTTPRHGNRRPSDKTLHTSTAASPSVVFPVQELVRPSWAPLAHIETGWQHLGPDEQAQLRQRLDSTLSGTDWDEEDRPALGRFFAFLAQVETIAIEIPIRALQTAPEHLHPQLRRQLADEVFHSTLFARLAHELALPDARPPATLASAERLLATIRDQKDMGLAATLLNLVAEGWIETIFEHAARWGIADSVFATVLEDESRHVEEALDYVDRPNPAAVGKAVAALEEGLLEVSQEPAVSLAMLRLAGRERYSALVRDLHATHRRHLAAIGLTPSETWCRTEEQTLQRLAADDDEPLPIRLPDTPWRRAARHVWDDPRDPTMQGGFDLPIGHVPRRLLTPVLVAAIGRAWAANPHLNRVVAQDGTWQLPRVNVGVRVLVAEDELATVVVVDADKRSVRDIQRMIVDGFEQLRAARAIRLRKEGSDGPAAADRPMDRGLAKLVPPQPAAFSVALSNPGKFGLVSGAGAFSSVLAPSSDISVGQRRRIPTWRGVGYWPVQHVHLGCLQDHRLFDGKQAGEAMQALQNQLTRRNLRRILRAPDTLHDAPVPDYEALWSQSMPPQLAMLSSVGIYKYIPWALGGLGLGAALGVGGYYLIKNMYADEDMVDATGSGADAEEAAGVEPGAPGTEELAAATDGEPLAPALTDGRPRCQHLTRAGTQCTRAVRDTGACRTHGGA